MSIAIVGPGRLGQAFGRLLVQAGLRVDFVAARRPAAAREAVRFMGGGRPVALTAPELARAHVILLTTSDGAVEQAAETLAGLRRTWKGRVVLHTSGSLPAAGPDSVLRAFKQRGAAVGSLHPFQTVPAPAAGVRSLVGCSWGIEGDARALKLAEQWVKILGGVAFRVRPERKILYHAAAFLVCPTAVALMDQAVRLLRKSGVAPGVSRPMLARFVAETAKNFAELGARAALTGPAARGDWQTIRRHLAALRRHAPEVVPVYRALLRPMLRLAGRRPPPGLL